MDRSQQLTKVQGLIIVAAVIGFFIVLLLLLEWADNDNKGNLVEEHPTPGEMTPVESAPVPQSSPVYWPEPERVPIPPTAG